MLVSKFLGHSLHGNLLIQGGPHHEHMVFGDPGDGQDLLRQDHLRKLDLRVDVLREAPPCEALQDVHRNVLAQLATVWPIFTSTCQVQLTSLFLLSRPKGLHEMRGYKDIWV